MDKKKIAFSLLTGVLLAFSYPNFIEKGIHTHTFFFAWFAYVPLLYVVINGRSKKGVFLHSLAGMSLFYLASIYWMCYVKPMGAGAYIAWLLLSVFCATFAALAFTAAFVLKKRYGVGYIFSLPAAYTVLEYCREWLFTGFPLLTPAQSQHQLLPFLQMMKYTGLYGPAFFILLVNSAIAAAVSGQKAEFKGLSAAASAITALALLCFSVAGNLPDEKGEKITAAIIQPDIDQDVIWTKSYKESSMKVLSQLVSGLKKEKPGLVVWPETAYPGILNIEPPQAANIASWLPGAYNLAGSDGILYSKGETTYYNSAFLINDKGAILGQYSKFHLVPFGEYMPFQHTFSFVKKVVKRYGYEGFTPGGSTEPLDFKGIKMGVVICFDGFFPEIARASAKKGARFIAHVSYETWYGDTPCSAQIFQNVALRSIENGMPLVRAVASGISGFVDSSGRILAQTKLFEKTSMAAEIEAAPQGKMTVYTRFGPWFVWVMVIALAALGLKKAEERK